jgi:predicted RNase H-like HicB family nuclease
VAEVTPPASLAMSCRPPFFQIVRVDALPPTGRHGSLSFMKQIAYCLYREDEFHVAQCLNVDVSTFGTTREEAVANLKEAVELYFEGETSPPFTTVSDVSIGQEMVNA